MTPFEWAVLIGLGVLIVSLWFAVSVLSEIERNTWQANSKLASLAESLAEIQEELVVMTAGNDTV